MKHGLRLIRASLSWIVGRLLATLPALEPTFIATGRWIAERSRLLGTLYWFSQEELLRQLRASGHRFRRLSVAGLEMSVDITDATGRLHYFYGEAYEPEMSEAVRRLLKAGDVFLDIGANIGYFSVLAGHIVGTTGHVVAFEPHPGAGATLRAAIAANGLSGVVEIVQAALGNARGTVRFFLSDDSVLSTVDPARSPARDHFRFDRSIDVELFTLDGWLAGRKDLTRIRAIKIDVEGTEDDVVEGMRGVIAACPAAAILCETGAGSASDRFFCELGYVRSTLDVRRGTFGNYLYERSSAG